MCLKSYIYIYVPLTINIFNLFFSLCYPYFILKYLVTQFLFAGYKNVNISQQQQMLRNRLSIFPCLRHGLC